MTLKIPRPLTVLPLAGLCFLCCLKVGFCLPATPALPAYTIHIWGVDDGLPDNFITSVVQTHDGYIWIATSDNLARFDGNRYTIFNNNNAPNFPSAEVTSLFEDEQGKLWIGCLDGELAYYENGHFEQVKVQPPWKDPAIWQIGNDRKNELWLVNRQGLFFRLKDGLLLTPAAGTILGFHSFHRSADGTMWIMRNGVLSAVEDGTSKVMQLDQSALTNAYVQAVCPSRDGGLWVASNGRLRKWNNHEWVDDLGISPWQYALVSYMMETRDGLLAIATPDHGLYIIRPHGETLCFNQGNGFHSDSINCLYEDREGNLWIGTDGSGLAMLRPGTFTIMDPPDHWHGRAVSSITIGRAGGLWAGTAGGGIYYYNNGQWTNYIQNWTGSNSPTPYISSVAEDTNGRLWLSTAGNGLFVQEADHFAQAPGWKNIPIGTTVNALLGGSDGSWWLGTSAGLAHYGNDVVSWPTLNVDNSLLDVRTVAEANDGTIWFGMNGRGLARLQNGLVQQFHKADGLPSDYVRCLHWDQDGALWIGTSAGLCRFKAGRFSTVKAEQGLPNEFISCIQDDGLGSFWMSSQGGVIRVSKAELNRCADGKVSSANFWCYDTSDGLPTKQCSGGFQPAGCRDTNGWLYFPTSKGLVKADPSDLRTNMLLPPVAIQRVTVDNQQVSFSGMKNSPLTIQPGGHRFEFDYIGLSFVAPKKVHYKYRLHGLDADWLSVGNKTTADYSFIPPGHYTFTVIACNNDGIWNKQGADLSFVVLPFFWQTIWFHTLAITMLVVTGSGAVWLDARRRTRRKLEHMKQQHAIEHERARIANDIHDDLGSHLTRITMLSESARNELEDREQSGSDLDQIYDTAREMTRAMDEIVWAVNPKHDTLESLANYLEIFAEDFLETAGVRRRLDMPLKFPTWPLTSEVRHNLFLAFKEALNNVVKHAGASEVGISIQVETGSFELLVQDNGHGFTLGRDETNPLHNPPRRSSGNGLENMRRRMLKIGGRCDISSVPGKGTRVLFIVPVQDRA